MRFKKQILLIFILLSVAGGLLFFAVQSDSKPDGDRRVNPTPTPAEPTVENFDKNARSISDPESLWVVVNKQRPLTPEDYVPTDLVVPDVRVRVPGNESMQMQQVAATAVEELFAAAQADGLELMLSSGYRSYAYQQNLYGSYVRSQGQAAADTQSARPGHSEHQTGLAVDIRPTNGECELEVCFGDMEEGKWLAANAHEYGFILRYSQTNTSEAGYSYEPWHFRYVGVDLAQEYVKSNATSLETFFSLPAAPDYN